MSKKKPERPLPQSLGLPFAGADSHAHLDHEGLLPDLTGMLQRAAESGVSLIVHMFLQHSRYAANRQLILDAAASLENGPDICFVRGLHGHKACPQGHFRCMKNIDPEDVWRDIERKLPVRKS